MAMPRSRSRDVDGDDAARTGMTDGDADVGGYRGWNGVVAVVAVDEDDGDGEDEDPAEGPEHVAG